MKRACVLVMVVMALVFGMHPEAAYAAYHCQQIPQFCCTPDGCSVCDTCTFCWIVNADGSDGGFVTDC